MADNLTTATIDVRANTRGLEKDILKALKTVEFSQIDTKKSSQALGRITGQVSEFNKSLEASNARVIAFGASAGAIFAVEKAFASLISSTIEVEKKLADINVLLNVSASGLEKFGNSLFGIAKNTAQTFSVVADAAAELARQGLGVEETLKRTNAALILTRLSGLDAKASVEALTATLNSFSGSALDAVEVVNKLANVDAAFAVSSADLANAISRVGSSAVDAGVSLDELVAIVTSAQQTTARGGSVIGNSFKTIFTRLQRGKVKDLLSELGIDTSETQNAVSLLKQLADVYDTLGATQKAAVAESVGGVFQINILKAALSDLGKEYSIYERALNTSLTSTDQAIKRNEILNQTISALSSQAFTNLEQAANKIGSLVFAPNAKSFLSGFNDLLSAFNNIDMESAGGKLMTGFFKGIGDFISGPGAVLATGVLVKLFVKLSQFAAGSAKELLGTNKAAQQQVAIEQSILSILQKNSQFTSQILTGKMTTVQAEKELLNYLTAQSNILREQERLSKIIGTNLRSAGVSIGASGVPMVAAAGKGKKAASSGYVPNFAADQVIGQAMENVGAREHGYKAGKARKTRIHDGNGKSFTSFVNSKEDVKTFTNAAGKKATIVRPPNGFGENTQYAAGGFVPNFVKNQASIRSGIIFEKRLNKSLKGASSFSPNAPMDFPLPEGYGADNQVKNKLGISSGSIYGDAKITRSRKSEQSLLDKYLRTAEGKADFTSSKETKNGFINLNPKGLSMLFSGSGADARGVAYVSTLNSSLSIGAQNLIKSKFGKSKKSRTLAMPYIADKINMDALSVLSSGFIPNFASLGSQFKAMYGGGTTMRAVDKEKTAKKKGLDVKKLDLSNQYTMVHGGSQGLESSSVSLEAGNKLFDAKIATAGLDLGGTNLQRYGIKGVVGDALVGATNTIIKTFGGKQEITDVSSLDNAGSVGSAAGTVFETALRKAFNAPAVSQTQRIDFPAPTPELKKFFHNAPGQYEAKISKTPDNLKSTLRKWIAVNNLASSASGFVPNFAKTSGLSFSQSKKDEFGFSSINAILGGKRVGSFSYAEDKPGEVEIGDLTVDKSQRGKGYGRALYEEAIRRNKGKKMKGQLLPQMNRVLEKIKKGESVSAETLYPQIKRADLAKSSIFEVYGHKGMTVEKMTRDQFSSFVNAKINELKKDPKKLQSYFGNVEADEYGGLGVDLQTQHSSGFIPNFLNVTKGGLPFGVRGRTNYGSAGSKTNIQLGAGAEIGTLAHELFHSAYSRSTFKKAEANPNIGKFLSSPGKYTGSGFLIGDKIFKNLNKNNLIKSLGLNPIQLDFDGKNPGATYSGSRAVDEIITRIQEKVFRNKGDLGKLSADENAFVKNLEEQGIISNKRLSNVSRRSQEGSKFRNLVEGKFSSVMGGAGSGFVPNFASPGLINEINKRILNPNVAQKLKEGQGLKDEAYIKAASRLGVNVSGLESYMAAMGFPLKGKSSIKKVSNALGFGFGRSFAIDALKMGDWNYVKSSFEQNGLSRSDFDKLSLFAKTPKGENAFKWGFRSKAAGFVPNFAKYNSRTSSSYMSSKETSRIVHPLLPQYDEQGRVSFPDLNKKRGSMKIIWREAMAGQDILSVDQFRKLAEDETRAKSRTFWKRNNFEYIYSSGGFVPNFADALNAAIAREKSAGLSSSQIYVDKHSSLKNKNNPMGLMVANTRDEPRGGMQGIKRAKKEGRNPKTYGAAAGFIPNFATGPIKPSQDYLDAMAAALKSVNSKLEKTAKSVDQFDKSVSESEIADGGGKRGIKGYLKDNALTIGFGLQALSGSISELAGGQETGGGRTISAIAQGAGTIAGFAGTGAMFGPMGAAVGAGIGVIKAFSDGIKMVNTKVPDLEKALEAGANSMNRFSESGQKILQLNEQYADALSSGGDPAKAADIMVKTQQAYAEELSKLTEAQRGTLISAIAQGKGQEGYAKILAEMQDSVKAQESALLFQKFQESGGIFGGPDKKIIEGLDKNLVQDFTRGLDASAIQKALDDVAANIEYQSMGTEGQAAELMKALASSVSLTPDQKINLEKVIQAFESAASETDLSAVAEGFRKGIEGKPKAFEDVKKAQEAVAQNAKANAEKLKKEVEIREKANAMLLKLQSDTEAVYQQFNNSIQDFISTMETSAAMRSASGEFKTDFYSQAGLSQGSLDTQKERNIIQSNADKLKIDIYKSQLDASDSFVSSLNSLLDNLDANVEKLNFGQTDFEQQNELLKIGSSLKQALLPVQSMILGGDFEGARRKTQDVIGGLGTAEVAALGQDKVVDVTRQLDQSLKKSARELVLIRQNSQRDLAIQAQQLIFQKAMNKLTQAQNFGGAGIKDIIGDEQGTAFNKAIESLSDLKILGFNQKDILPGSKNAVRGGTATTLGIKGEKPNAAMSSALIDFYQAASLIGGQSVLSTESKDFGVLAQAVSEQIRKKMDELRAAGEGVVDPMVFARLESTLATLGGTDKVAQLKIFKELGVANVSGKQVIDEALKQYSGGAFAGLSPELKKAFENTTDEGAGATLLLIAGQEKQTDTLSSGLAAVTAAGIESNSLLAAQPEAIASAIGAILEKGRAETTKNEAVQAVQKLDKEWRNTGKQITSNSTDIKNAQKESSAALSVLGDIPTGVSKQDFIKQQETSIDKNELEKAKILVGNYAKQEELSGSDKFKALFSGMGNAILAGSAGFGELMTLGQFDLGSSIRRQAADKDFARADSDPKALEEEYNKALALIQKNTALETFKQQEDVISKKEKENESLSKKRVDIESQQVEASKKSKQAFEQFQQASQKAAISQNLKPALSGSDYIDNLKATKDAKERSIAEALAVKDLEKTKIQKQAQARTSGRETMLSPYSGQQDTYENVAITKFGGANAQAFAELQSQNVVPSLKAFSEVYKSMGLEGGAEGAFRKIEAEMLGPKTFQKTAAQIAAEQVPIQQRGSIAGGGVSIGENQALLKKFGYKQGEGFASSELEKQYKEELKKLKESKLKPTTGAGVVAPGPVGGQVSPASQQSTNQPPKPDNAQQDVNQIISNILVTVQQIATGLEKKATTETGGQVDSNVANAGGAQGVNVNNSVSFSVNSANGQAGSDAAMAVAEQIKAGLSAFLSSPEFVGKVTSIANQAAGNKLPPKV